MALEKASSSVFIQACKLKVWDGTKASCISSRDSNVESTSLSSPFLEFAYISDLMFQFKFSNQE